MPGVLHCPAFSVGKEELRLNVLKLLLILCILILASVTDFRKREVPNIYIILIILTALIDFRASNMLGSVISAPFYFAQKDGKNMGGGDLKLAFALGFSLGLAKSLMTVIFGCIVFITAGAVCEIANGKKGKLFPFVPALTAGYIITILMEVLA